LKIHLQELLLQKEMTLSNGKLKYLKYKELDCT
jgi:hypothetical protein